MKKRILLILVCIFILSLTACDSNELNTNVCDNCDETITDNAKFCPNCGIPLENSNNNQISTQESETTPPQQCNHEPGEWIMISASTCSKEGMQQKKCTICNAVLETSSISIIEHTASVDAAIQPTCTTIGKSEGSHCAVCGEVLVAPETIPAIGHNYVNNICSNCNEPDPVFSNALAVAERVKIYGTYIHVNSADGVSVYITWENRSSKEIKYIYFRVELFNRVNDRLDCDISGDYEKWLKQTGPIPQGKGMYNGGAGRHFLPEVSNSEHDRDESNGWASRYWDNMWYNSTAHYVKVTGIEIEYMDGSTYTMHDKEAFDKLNIINVSQSESVRDYDYVYPVSSQLLTKGFPYENEDVRIDKLIIEEIKGVGENEASFTCRLHGYSNCDFLSIHLSVFDEHGNQVGYVVPHHLYEKGDFSEMCSISTPRSGIYYIVVDSAYGY